MLFEYVQVQSILSQQQQISFNQGELEGGRNWL